MPSDSSNSLSFTAPIRVFFRDCDALGRPKPSAWLSWMVELAGDDFASRGFPRSVLLQNNQVFLLARASYQVEKSPRYDELLTVRTWEDRLDAIYCMRGYAFYGADHALLARAESAWLLCDPTTHRILRPKALCAPYRLTGENAGGFPAGALDRFSGEALGEYRVGYTDLDVNGHLFSAAYGDVALDFLPEDIRARRSRGFTINYIKEARLDERLSLFGRASDNAYDMIAEHQDGAVCFIARYYL